ncbi:MAG: hypothetical protein ACRENA_06015 [Vulcanimicrobiaceae bacterium]
MIERAYAVTLAIPDNEAATALTTLQRLGVPCAGIARAAVHVFDTDDNADENALERTLRTVATVYNPNKHRLRRLERPRPGAGEVWITAGEPPAPHERVVIGGVELPGVHRAWQATSWRLLDESGRDVPAPILERAVETLLCNPAFQRAIRA